MEMDIFRSNFYVPCYILELELYMYNSANTNLDNKERSLSRVLHCDIHDGHLRTGMSGRSVLSQCNTRL